LNRPVGEFFLPKGSAAMLIRTRLHFAILFQVIMGLVLAAMLHFVYQYEGRVARQSTAVGQIVEGSFRLEVLTHDYCKSGSQIWHNKWLRLHAGLGGVLKKPVMRDLATQEDLRMMLYSHEQAGLVFGELEKVFAEPDSGGLADPSAERKRDLEEHLRRHIEDLFENASKLHREQDSLLEGFEVSSAWLALVCTAFLAVAMGLLSYRLGRGINVPLARLRHGIELVGRGDLEHRVASEASDEVGELSRAFDRMIEQLKTTTVSRDALEGRIAERTEALSQSNQDLLAEIEDHRRAQEELSKYRDRLQELVEERTASLRQANERLQREILERLEAEEALQREQYLMNALMDTIPDRIYFKNRDSHFIRINRAVAQLFGLTDPNEAQGSSDADFLEPDHAAHTLADEKRIVETGEPILGRESERRRPDGQSEWISTTKMPLHDRTGNIVGTFGISRDITEHKRAENALRKSEERHRLLLETMNEGFAVMDAAARFTYVNGVFCRMLGATREEIVGTEVHSFFDERNRAVLERQLENRRSGARTPYEIAWLSKSGQTVPTIVSPQPMTDERGGFAGSFSVITNIAALKETQEKLVRSNRELEQFAYIASHDLQEPLRMVGSFTQLLARRYQGKLGKDADEFIGFAVDGAKRMQRLLNDLLAYSRVTTKARPLAATEAEVVFSHVRANLQLAIDDAGAEVTHDPLPAVLADETQFIQLLQNLIANALKFRRDEPLRIHVSARRDGAFWQFDVRDNGRGIAGKDFERIFQIFQRGGGHEDVPGTGIGLAICKKIVERHGGALAVTSREGEGSTFQFTLRAKAESEL
jgi:PAS domain S-box-containing protein